MVLLGPGCKLVRDQTAEAGVRPAGIIIEPPAFNNLPRHRQARAAPLGQLLGAKWRFPSCLPRITASAVIMIVAVVLVAGRGDRDDRVIVAVVEVDRGRRLVVVMVLVDDANANKRGGKQRRGDHARGNVQAYC